jgi:hypothetical protein
MGFHWLSVAVFWENSLQLGPYVVFQEPANSKRGYLVWIAVPVHRNQSQCSQPHILSHKKSTHHDFYPYEPVSMTSLAAPTRNKGVQSCQLTRPFQCLLRGEGH